jgi:hypothetical protein
MQHNNVVLNDYDQNYDNTYFCFIILTTYHMVLLGYKTNFTSQCDHILTWRCFAQGERPS